MVIMMLMNLCISLSSIEVLISVSSMMLIMFVCCGGVVGLVVGVCWGLRVWVDYVGYVDFGCDLGFEVFGVGVVGYWFDVYVV